MRSAEVVQVRLQRQRPRAGRYVGLWFDATHAVWRRRMRPRVAIAALPVVVPFGLLCLVWPAFWEFYAGVAMGAVATMYVWALDSPPEWIERKRRGRDGERRTERQLASLGRDGWVISHDVDARRGNFDHIVVGPPGAYLVETKVFQGRAAFDDDGLILRRGDDERDSWRPTPPIDRAARGAAAELKARLAPAGVRWVHPIVVLWCDVDLQVVEHNGVTFVHGTRVASWLRGQRGSLSAEVVERTRTVLERLETGGAWDEP